MLEGYPALNRIIENLDEFLEAQHPSFFGKHATHPHSSLKAFKVIHDNLWGTNRFTWREMVVMDSPIMQRLRGIHQTGLAHFVYPTAHHTRFEHSLGVLTVASRVFDSLRQRHSKQVEDAAKVASNKTNSADIQDYICQMRQELRLAALLHDTGHSLFSHASEQVYSNLGLIQEGINELTKFTGKEKGAGEVLSFCLTRTRSLADLLNRAKEKVSRIEDEDDAKCDVNLCNVSYLIVGRSNHPLMQFMGDIISSGFDADKLDYLLRDANAAGLPLKYDLERYLYTVFLEQDALSDEAHELQRFYAAAGSKPEIKPPAENVSRYKHFEAYRLRLPKLAMSTIEQIIICKLMLYSYIYHHPKVRAAEGLLIHLLQYKVEKWRENNETDEQVLNRFLSMTDSALDGNEFLNSEDEFVKRYSYQIQNRLLPRQVLRLNAATASEQDAILYKNFLTKVKGRKQGPEVIRKLELSIGSHLCSIDKIFGSSPEKALLKTGTWVDVPKAPKFEDTSVLIERSKNNDGIKISDVFPIDQWTEAYEAHKFYIRIYSFSEYFDAVEHASRLAIGDVL